MSRFEEPRLVLAGSFRSGRLWLLQFLVNPILAGLFAAWLLIPEAKLWQLAFNVLLAVVIVAAALLLHAGTLNYFNLCSVDAARCRSTTHLAGPADRFL